MTWWLVTRPRSLCGYSRWPPRCWAASRTCPGSGAVALRREPGCLLALGPPVSWVPSPVRCPRSAPWTQEHVPLEKEGLGGRSSGTGTWENLLSPLALIARLGGHPTQGRKPLPATRRKPCSPAPQRPGLLLGRVEPSLVLCVTCFELPGRGQHGLFVPGALRPQGDLPGCWSRGPRR